VPANLSEPKKEDVMENLDLIIFTIIISTSFVFFGVSTFKEFKKASESNKD
jgi:hypothetical protein